MKKLLKLTALALAAMSLACTGASAQMTTAANPGDLILGFSVTDGMGTGAFTDLELDLGPASAFTPSASFTSLATLGSDLTATYGSWATRTDLVFGAAGVTATPSSNTYVVTQAVGGATTVSNVNLGGAKNKITPLINGTAGTTSNVPFADNNSAIALGDGTNHASSLAGSFTAQLTANNNLGATYLGNINDDSSANGPGGVMLGLYQFTGGSTTTPAGLLGSFTLGNTGVLSFKGVSANAVPEPSAYALGICAVVLFVVLKRRRDLVA